MKIGLTGASVGYIESFLRPALEDAGHTCHRFNYPQVFRNDLDCIIHLAAIVGRDKGESNLRNTAAINGGMTAEVAKHCAAKGLRLIYISSSEIYMPHNLYGLSKRWGEEACQLYNPPGLTILRLSMPYGPSNPPRYDRSSISNFLRAFVRGQTVTIHEGATRSYCWVEDVCRGIVALMDNTDGGVYNVGRDDDERSMLEIADLCNYEATGGKGTIEVVPIPPGFTPRKPLVCSELLGLGWKPAIELERGISVIASSLTLPGT